MPNLLVSPLYRAVAAEFVGSAWFLFITITTLVDYPALPIYGNSTMLAPIGIAAIFGMSISTLAYTFGDISGAHLNPSVTLAHLCQRSIRPKRAALYVAAQVSGAICGACFARLVCDWDLYDRGSKGVNRVLAGHALWQALLAEIAATCLLATVVLQVLYAATKLYGHGPLAIGGAVLVCHLALIPITGTSINPARSIGAAVASGSNDHKQWTHIWVFLVGPSIGGLLAGLNPLWVEHVPEPAHVPGPATGLTA